MQGCAVEILQELLVASGPLRRSKQVLLCHSRTVDILLFDKLLFAPAHLSEADGTRADTSASVAGLLSVE